MADVAYRDSAVGANTGTASATVTVTVPATAVVGDLLVLWSSTRAALSSVSSPSSAWTLAVDDSGTLANSNGYVHQKICEAADIGAVITVTQASAVGRIAAVVTVWSPPTSGFNATPVASLGAVSDATSPHTAPAGSTTVDLSAVLTFQRFTSSGSGASWTTTTGTDRASTGSALTGRQNIKAIQTNVATLTPAGAYTQAETTTTTGESIRSVVVAIQPSATAAARTDRFFACF